MLRFVKRGYSKEDVEQLVMALEAGREYLQRRGLCHFGECEACQCYRACLAINNCLDYMNQLVDNLRPEEDYIRKPRTSGTKFYENEG